MVALKKVDASHFLDVSQSVAGILQAAIDTSDASQVSKADAAVLAAHFAIAAAAGCAAAGMGKQVSAAFGVQLASQVMEVLRRLPDAK